MRVKFKICFKFGLKIKKFSIYEVSSAAGSLDPLMPLNIMSCAVVDGLVSKKSSTWLLH
jgi:hypothetical protein